MTLRFRFTLDEAKARWDARLARVEAGEAVLIARNGAPVARLTCFGSNPASESVETAIAPFEPKP